MLHLSTDLPADHDDGKELMQLTKSNLYLRFGTAELNLPLLADIAATTDEKDVYITYDGVTGDVAVFVDQTADATSAGYLIDASLNGGNFPEL